MELLIVLALSATTCIWAELLLITKKRLRAAWMLAPVTWGFTLATVFAGGAYG